MQPAWAVDGILEYLLLTADYHLYSGSPAVDAGLTIPTGWSTTKTASHTYTLVGAYTVRLEVQDTGGLTGTTTRQVTVSEQTTDHWVFLPLALRNFQ